MRRGSVLLLAGVWAAVGCAHAETLDELVVAAAAKNDLPVALLRAVATVESGMDVKARSRRGALGLMQLMPATARRFGVVDPLDPRQSLEGGCRYLTWLRKEFRDDVVLVLAAYNAGEGAVRAYGGVPPYAETQGYVRRVLATLRAEGAGSRPMRVAMLPATSSVVVGGP